MKLLNWIYEFKSYNQWRYRDGEVVLTKDYILFGKNKQKEIKGEEYHWAMMFGAYNIHKDCE